MKISSSLSESADWEKSEDEPKSLDEPKEPVEPLEREITVLMKMAGAHCLDMEMSRAASMVLLMTVSQEMIM